MRLETSSSSYWVNRNLSRASMYWHTLEQKMGTVSSNSQFQTALFQQYSANLSVLRRPTPQRETHPPSKLEHANFAPSVHSPQVLRLFALGHGLATCCFAKCVKTKVSEKCGDIFSLPLSSSAVCKHAVAQPIARRAGVSGSHRALA